jgi:multidrug resistance efflux pump
MDTADNRDPGVARVEEAEAHQESAEMSAADATGVTTEETAKTKDPVRRITLALILTAALLFIWHVAADRVAPWADEARVQAWVIPIAPKVSGTVTRVNVSPDQRVKAGELLAVIDPEEYEIAVQRAEAALELAGQDLNVGVAAVNMAQAKLVEAKAVLVEREIHFTRTESLVEKNAASQAALDRARADRERARAQVSSAQAELDRAKQQLGPEGQSNPRIRDALAALRQARIDLADTKIRAPSDGGITNLKIDQGYYANKGTPVMTFVSFDDVWIQANLRENSIFNIKPGDRVELTLDTMPGRILRGTVFSSGFAVQPPSGAAVGEAVIIRSSSGWLRDAQRFPVIIYFDRDEFPRGYRRVGGQADVQIYTQKSNWLLNGLGWLRIRLSSWLSYVY